MVMMKRMKYFISMIFSCILLLNATSLYAQNNKDMYTYLAIGDSYTIGEQVPAEGNFPNQTVTLLHDAGISVASPKIIAVTGWTTDELKAGIEQEKLSGTYSFVTLLIGVNNQYRGRSVENFKEEFTELLQQAIAFANGDENKVFVLSIPDWGVTPFAEGRDRRQIAKEIDAYNQAKEDIVKAHNCHWLNITPSTRANGTDEDYLVADKLHYAAKEYALWAKQLAEMVKNEL